MSNLSVKNNFNSLSKIRYIYLYHEYQNKEIVAHCVKKFVASIKSAANTSDILRTRKEHDI